MVITVDAAKEEVCSLKVEDSLADPDRIVERRMQRMGGLLVLGKELKVLTSHISAPLSHQDLVTTFKVPLIPLSDLNYIGLNLVPCFLAAIGLATFEDLGKHTVDVHRDWIVREYIGVEGAHVYMPGKGACYGSAEQRSRALIS